MEIPRDSLEKYKNHKSIENFLSDRLTSLNPQNRNIKIRYPEIYPRFN